MTTDCGMNAGVEPVFQYSHCNRSGKVLVTQNQLTALDAVMFEQVPQLPSFSDNGKDEITDKFSCDMDGGLNTPVPVPEVPAFPVLTDLAASCVDSGVLKKQIVDIP